MSKMQKCLLGQKKKYPKGTKRKCKTCGIVFTLKFKAEGLYCSRSCVGKTRTGDKNSNWRGGRRKIIEGRIAIYSPNHPRAGKQKTVFEYQLVAEKKLGRYLEKNEIVHHINDNPLDNRPENLEVMTQAEHARLHMLTRKRDAKGRMTSEFHNQPKEGL